MQLGRDRHKMHCLQLYYTVPLNTKHGHLARCGSCSDPHWREKVLWGVQLAPVPSGFRICCRHLNQGYSLREASPSPFCQRRSMAGVFGSGHFCPMQCLLYGQSLFEGCLLECWDLLRAALWSDGLPTSSSFFPSLPSQVSDLYPALKAFPAYCCSLTPYLT